MGILLEHFPYAFASGDEAFPRIAGGVLWLVTSPHFGAYRLPPSLVARLRSSMSSPAILRRPRTWTSRSCEAGGGWLWPPGGGLLPVNNALHTLQQLRFRGVVDRLPDLGMEVAARDHEDHEDQEEREEREDGDSLRLYSGIPGRFRRHRVVAAESAPVLEDYAAAVRSGRRVS